MKLLINTKGQIKCLYAENEMSRRLQGAKTMIRTSLARASHVEPDNSTNPPQWWIRLLYHLTRLGPYPTRSQALEAEVAWLEEGTRLEIPAKVSPQPASAKPVAHCAGTFLS